MGTRSWFRQTEGLSVPVTCAPHVDSEGAKSMVLTVGGSTAVLTEEAAASLGGYLLGSTNNDTEEASTQTPATVPQGGGI